MGYVAVIDHGKSNTRVAIFDAEGGQVAERSRPTPTAASGAYPSEDVEALIPFVLEALAAFSPQYGIESIIPVAHGAAGALIDRDGLVLPVVDYEHTPSPALNEAYDALRPPFAETASPRLPAGHNLGRQLYMLETAFPDAVARAEAFLPLAQYWAWVLSGRMVSEVTSLGAHTDLWSPSRQTTSSLVARLGWGRLIPPLRKAGDAIGPIRPEIAQRTGLDPATRVLAGLHDSNASLVPYFSDGSGPVAVVSTGTWIIVMNVGGDSAYLDPAADMLANVDILGRPTPSARFMGGREFATIAGEDAPASIETAWAVLQAGTLALPSFSAQGGPWASLEGRILGHLPPMPGARSALACLYCALVTDNLLTRLGVTGPVFVDGPFAQNDVWLAALSGLRAGGICPQGAASPAAGAAMLARAAPKTSPAATAYPERLDLGSYRQRWMAAIDQRGV